MEQKLKARGKFVDQRFDTQECSISQKGGDAAKQEMGMGRGLYSALLE
jgi:hypothetical protein